MHQNNLSATEIKSPKQHLDNLARATKELENKIRDYKERQDKNHIPEFLKKQAG